MPLVFFLCLKIKEIIKKWKKLTKVLTKNGNYCNIILIKGRNEKNEFKKRNKKGGKVDK